MASALVDQLGRWQPATPPPKLAPVACSDSDNETSFDTSDLQARSTDDQMAAEGLMALSVAQANSIEYLINDSLIFTAARTNRLKKAATNEFGLIAEGSGRSGQAEIVYKTANGDDDTVPDVDETHDIEFETTFEEANEVDGSTDKPRCWGDIKYPRIGTCDHEFKIVNKGERYRKVVSNFFGRNKKATASVPPDCYPTICRTCYQRLAYRFPTIEVIPVPIGLRDEQIVKEKRKLRVVANKMKNDTKKAATEAERQGRGQTSNSFRKKIARNKRKEANDALAQADARQRDVDHAQEDALMSAATIPGKRLKPNVTRGKAGKVRIDLKRVKAIKVVEHTTKVSKDHDDSSEYEQFDNGDVEVDASTPPVKRVRISEKPERKNYKASVIKKYGSWPPPPAANVAGIRARMAEARRDGYGPASVRRMPGEPYVSGTKSESE